VSDAIALRYRAFISYSHADTPWGKWLHGKLEGFQLGDDLIGRETAVGRVPNTLRPVFRDRDEFTAGHSLSDQTLAALDESMALIVICSPNAAKSHYVNEEIRLFKSRHADRLVLPLIVDDVPGQAQPQCFPPALAFKVSDDGTVTATPEAILAADARKTGDGSDLALAKVVASLIGVPVDDVRKREAINQAWWIKVTAAVVAVVAVLALVTVFLVREHKLQETRQEAQDKVQSGQLADIRALVGRALVESGATPHQTQELSSRITEDLQNRMIGKETLANFLARGNLRVAADPGTLYNNYLSLAEKYSGIEQRLAKIVGSKDNEAQSLSTAGQEALATGDLEAAEALARAAELKQTLERQIQFDQVSDGSAVITNDWDRDNIIKVEVPQLSGIPSFGGVLGNVPRIPFHKFGAEQLRAAFAEIESAGLLTQVHQWCGSYVQGRLIRGSRSILSAHALGIAFDINCDELRSGRKIDLSKEQGLAGLVEILRKHGFVWGGSNRIPDPNHFQLYRLDATAAN
jgi:TIR domain/D-alanyl-D-alanine carboxypeptidase